MPRMPTIAAAIAALTLAGAAFAASPEMEATFGNTVTQANADGSEITNLFNEDGTVTRIDNDGKEAQGTWDENGGELCVTFEERVCWEKTPGKKAGDSWETTAPDGSKVTISITEGR